MDINDIIQHLLQTNNLTEAFAWLVTIQGGNVTNSVENNAISHVISHKNRLNNELKSGEKNQSNDSKE